MNELTERATQVGDVKYRVKFRDTNDGQVVVEFWRPHGVFGPHFTMTVPPSDVESAILQIQSSLEEREKREQMIASKLYGSE